MCLKGISSISAAQASGVDDSVESVLQWISCIEEEWLIVFDNADNPSPDVVARFIPSGNRGNILITSRNPSMGRLVSSENIFEINEMEELDAISLLLKASHIDALPEHLEAARRLVTKLGCIPLAVEHAGAYIYAGKSSINKYLKQFSLHCKDLMSDDIFRGASNYNQTVYGTWDLSLKEIKQRADGQSGMGNAQAAQAAILILHICAFYHHNNISKAIFQFAAEESQKYVVNHKVANELPQGMNSLNCNLLTLDKDGHWDDFIFEKGIIVLLSFSLMKKEQSTEILSFHPLVHSWSREQLPKYEQQRMYEMGSIILACAVSWRFTSYDYALRQLIFPHIKANELYGDEMRLEKKYYDDKYNNFGLVMSENGDWKNAEEMQVQVMDMRKKFLGSEHPDTLESMLILADTYSDLGEWKEAEQLQFQVMDMRKKLLGVEHPDTLTSMGNIAGTYSKQGKLNEAEQLEIQVMDMSKKILGVEHRDTLTSMENMAKIYTRQDKWNEAEKLQVQVMDMRRKMLGVEHPDTLTGMGNLASTYSKQGKWNEAEKLQIQVMNMRKKLLGVHPHTFISMGHLAIIYNKQGKLNEAEQLQVQVMNMSKKLLGEEHPDTLISMGNLASIYSKQGKWNEAEQLQVQAMDMSKMLGAEHPDTLISMGNLARIYRKQGKWNEAEQLQAQVMNIRKKMLVQNIQIPTSARHKAPTVLCTVYTSVLLLYIIYS